MIRGMFEATPIQRDCRAEYIDRAGRLQGMPSIALVEFSVFVRRDDGVVRRFDVPSPSRYIAADQAEKTLRAREESRTGRTVAVLMGYDPRLPVGIGDECQRAGRCEFTVAVENRSGIQTAVRVWAGGRDEALELAMRKSRVGRSVFVQVRYRCIGRCGYCHVPLFADMKTRTSGKSVKCLDCA